MYKTITKTQIHIIGTVFFCFVLIFSFFSFTRANLSNRSINITIKEKLTEKSQDSKIGFISNEQDSQLAFKLYYFKDDKNIIPVSAFYPNLFEEFDNLTNDRYPTDHKYSRKNVNYENIKKNIKENKLSQYLFLKHTYLLPVEFNKNEDILLALTQTCEISEEITIEGTPLYKLYVFDNCTH